MKNYKYLIAGSVVFAVYVGVTIFLLKLDMTDLKYWVFLMFTFTSFELNSYFDRKWKDRNKVSSSCSENRVTTLT